MARKLWLINFFMQLRSQLKWCHTTVKITNQACISFWCTYQRSILEWTIPSRKHNLTKFKETKLKETRQSKEINSAWLKQIVPVNSLKKQLTFCNAITCFPMKWYLRKDCCNSILLTCHYPHLRSASDWSCSKGNFLQSIRSPAQTNLQVATILVAMAPKILKLATWVVKKSP